MDGDIYLKPVRVERARGYGGEAPSESYVVTIGIGLLGRHAEVAVEVQASGFDEAADRATEDGLTQLELLVEKWRASKNPGAGGSSTRTVPADSGQP